MELIWHITQNRYTCFNFEEKLFYDIAFCLEQFLEVLLFLSYVQRIKTPFLR